MSHHEIKKPEDIQVPPSSFLGKLPMLGGILAVAGLGATLGFLVAGAAGQGVPAAIGRGCSAEGRPRQNRVSPSR